MRLFEVEAGEHVVDLLAVLVIRAVEQAQTARVPKNSRVLALGVAVNAKTTGSQPGRAARPSPPLRLDGHGAGVVGVRIVPLPIGRES